MADKAKILIVCGPTATGKTALAVKLAKILNAEIICADSMQIYKHLSIGTAKVTPEETEGVKHHIVDFLHPKERFSVAEYVSLASQCIKDINKKGKLCIVVGGTGQYINSLICGMSFTTQKTSDDIRENLYKRLEIEGIDSIYNELCEIDLAYAKNIHKNNHVRVIRAMELYLQTGKTMSTQIENSIPKTKPYNDVIIGVNYSSRQELYSNINKRVDVMMSKGLLQEAKTVYDNADEYITAAQAIGYKEFFKYFDGESNLDDCVLKLKQATRNYAKRQLTWFNKMPNINWLNAQDEMLVQKAVNIYKEQFNL